jgi:putative inorganic carbon (hco3(-)) transporter
MRMDFGLLTILSVPALLLFILVTLRPRLGLVALVFAVYTNLSDILISKFGFPSIAQPLVAILILVIITRRLVFQDEFQGWIAPTLLMGTFTLLGSLSLFYASDISQATASLLSYLKDVIIGLVVVFLIQTPRSLRWAVWALLISGILMGTISVFQELTGTFGRLYAGFGQVAVLSAGEYRLAGVVNDPNFYGQILVVLVPLAFDRLLHEKPILLRVLAGWALFVCTVTILFTYSRGDFLALGVVGLLLIILQPKRPWIPAFLVLAFGLLIYQFIPEQYSQRISSLLQVIPGASTSATVDTSLQARATTDIVGWTMFTYNPIFGVGVGNFNTLYDYYARQLGLGQNVETESAHNLFLQIAAERGIVGFFSFAAIIYFTFVMLARARTRFSDLKLSDLANLSTAMSISLTGYLVAAFFLHDSYIRYLWLLVGMACSFPQAARTSISSVQSDEEQGLVIASQPDHG